MPKGEIFKIQIDMSGSQILAYNKKKTVLGEYPADKAIKKFMGDNRKIYVYGYVDNSGLLHIVRRVKEQFW